MTSQNVAAAPAGDRAMPSARCKATRAGAAGLAADFTGIRRRPARVLAGAGPASARESGLTHEACCDAARPGLAHDTRGPPADPDDVTAAGCCHLGSAGMAGRPGSRAATATVP